MSKTYTPVLIEEKITTMSKILTAYKTGKKSSVQGLNFVPLTGTSPPSGTSPNLHLPQLAPPPTGARPRLKSPNCRYTSLECKSLENEKRFRLSIRLSNTYFKTLYDKRVTDCSEEAKVKFFK